MRSRETGKDKEYHCHVKTVNWTRIDDAITGCHLVIGIKCWTETSDNLRIKPSHTFHPFSSFYASPSASLSLFYSFSLSVTQPVNWCLYINECRLIEAWHNVQPYYHAFIFMEGNCKGLADSMCACDWRMEQQSVGHKHNWHIFFLCTCVLAQQERDIDR